MERVTIRAALLHLAKEALLVQYLVSDSGPAAGKSQEGLHSCHYSSSITPLILYSAEFWGCTQVSCQSSLEGSFPNLPSKPSMFVAKTTSCGNQFYRLMMLYEKESILLCISIRSVSSKEWDFSCHADFFSHLSNISSPLPLSQAKKLQMLLPVWLVSFVPVKVLQCSFIWVVATDSGVTRFYIIWCGKLAHQCYDGPSAMMDLLSQDF